MTIRIGGLGQTISAYCPVCSQKMSHYCIMSRTVRYEWQCAPCELSLKSDIDGNAHLLTEMALYN